MKLKTKLTLSVILVVLVTMTVIAYGLRRAYSDSFFTYLEQTEKERMDRIIRDIGGITREEGINLTSPVLNSQLQVYARDTNINITLMDLESTIVANYRGLVPNDNAQIQVDQYRLINNKGHYVGTMLVTYDRSNPALAMALKEFQARSLNSTLFGLFAFLVMAVVFSTVFSRKITKPIESVRDATEQIREENFDVTIPDSDIREIQSLASNVQFLASTLRQQEKARRSYAQDISHELRTPLTNLRLHTEAMKDGILPADEENMGILEANIAQLTLLVDRLKASFREASMVAAESIQSVDCSALTHRVLDGFVPQLNQKDAHFERQIPNEILLETDDRLYAQVLTNLISNAIKAIDRNGTITVSLMEEKNAVSLSVQDDGSGIPSKDLPHLFDRFYRVDSSRNRQVGGQGLGLSITKNIVQQLGGRIKVTSRVGRGTTFWITYPKSFLKRRLED